MISPTPQSFRLSGFNFPFYWSNKIQRYCRGLSSISCFCARNVIKCNLENISSFPAFRRRQWFICFRRRTCVCLCINFCKKAESLPFSLSFARNDMVESDRSVCGWHKATCLTTAGSQCRCFYQRSRFGFHRTAQLKNLILIGTFKTNNLKP